MSTNNELWRIQTGYIAGYTEDKDLIQRIRRYKTNKNWKQTAEYFKDGKRIGVQYRIPIEQRRPAERMFDTKLD